MLVWIVNAERARTRRRGFFVVISFFVLRRNEPGLDRPLKLPFGYAFGAAALVLTLSFMVSLARRPVGVLWPYERLIVLFWALPGRRHCTASRRPTRRSTWRTWRTEKLE